MTNEKEKLLTRYLIFETDADAITFTRVGEQLANGAEEALRKYYADPPQDREGFSVAVSENAFKLRQARARVTTSLTDVELAPVGSAPASEEEPARQEELV